VVGSSITPNWLGGVSSGAHAGAPANIGGSLAEQAANHLGGGIINVINTGLQPGATITDDYGGSFLQGFVNGGVGPTSSLR
jgi:hypothetical protein